MNFSVVPGVGSFVFAKSLSRVDQYDKAVVCDKNHKKVSVKYLNGQKQTFAIRQFECVVWNVEPNAADLRIGTLVITSEEEHGREQVMMLGRIREIKTNARKKTTYLVDLFDGKSIVVNLARLRVIPEGDQPSMYFKKCFQFSLFT